MSLAEIGVAAAEDVRPSAAASMGLDLTAWRGCLDGALEALHKALLDATAANAARFQRSPAVASKLCAANSSVAAHLGRMSVNAGPTAGLHSATHGDAAVLAAVARAERFADECLREVSDVTSLILNVTSPRT